MTKLWKELLKRPKNNNIQLYILGAIQKCQHFHECTNSTHFHTSSPKVYRPICLGSKTRVLCSTTFIVQQQKLTCLRSLLCYKLCIMIYRLQLILYTSKFNLNIYFLMCSISQYKILNAKISASNMAKN